MKFFFVRHGNTFEKNEIPKQVGCKTDLPLTETGIQQIKKLKKHFEKNKCFFNSCYCGLLKRQIQTAKILSDNNIITPFLTEIDYGLWENLSANEIKHQWPKEYSSWIARGEWPKNIFIGTEKDHINKLQTIIKNITNTHNSNSNIILVSSQGVIRYLLVLTKHWRNIVKNKNMGNYKINPGNVCILETKNKQLKILGWNKSPTLG